MRQSELRRGNWVISDSGKVSQIKGVNLQSEPAGAWPIVEIEHIGNYVSDLKPIPLTEEWLNKLGFTEKEEWPSRLGTNFFNKKRNVVIGLSNRYGKTIRLVSDRHVDVYMIDYVHELQNIYQYLTGEIV